MIFFKILLLIIFILLFLILLAVIFYVRSKKNFFCAYPRTEIYGDTKQLKFIFLKGFLFIIANDIFCTDIEYQNEIVNLAFKYNLKPDLNPKEVLKDKNPLNIEIMDVKTGETLSYSVKTNANKIRAIVFFNNYRKLIERIYLKNKR